MAKLSMQKICICALKKDRKKILEILQRLGVIEVSYVDVKTYGLEQVDTSSRKSIFEKNRLVAMESIEILDKYIPAKSGLLDSIAGPKDITKGNYYTFADETDEIMRIAYKIVELNERISDVNLEIQRLNTQLSVINKFENLSVPLGFKGTKKTRAFIGSLPGNLEKSNIISKILNIEPKLERLEIEIISREKNQTNIFVLAHADDAKKVESILKSIGFSFPPLKTTIVPEQEEKRLIDEISLLRQEISTNTNEIISYKGMRNAIKFIVDYYGMRIQKYDVISRLGQTQSVFILTGYITKNDSEVLKRAFNEIDNIYIGLNNPNKEDDVPVKLINNSFSSPVEGVLESYSLPGKKEVDPTSVMSIFYYVLFGLMLSDAAYGIIITLVCGIVGFKLDRVKLGLKKAMRMFFYCGISTTFWGIMFGSYFGDAVDVISSTFFNHKVTIPAVWFVPIDEPMRMLAFSFLLGVIHLFAGLFMQLYQLYKAKQYKDIIYDVISWYLLVGGLIIYMLSIEMVCEMLVLNFVLPKFIGIVGAVLALMGAILILFTAGRESRSPFKRFLKGLYGLYGITGYLSDILSYSRLLALGLATGVIAQVFNKMGAMGGTGVLGVILFTLVFIIGHAMNIAINILGAYVHTNRLQFVEFFGKFYEGGGRKFSPFFIDTKYYRVVEDKNNG